jgi:hypothetical protein
MNPDDIVPWVKYTLHKKDCRGFIKKYLKEYRKIKSSFDKTMLEVPEPGPYFINFINTCNELLVSNPNYYHYRPDMDMCQRLPNPGPTLVYSLLLKHIVHNAESYSTQDAVKIDTLLFSWFEQMGITGVMIVPLDKRCKDIFKENNIASSRDDIGEMDGYLKYCSLRGKVKSGGMDISNTRVTTLLNKIHNVRPNYGDGSAYLFSGDGAEGGAYLFPGAGAGATPFLATPFPATPAGVNPFIATPAGAGIEEVDGGKKRNAKTNKRTRRRPSIKFRHTRRRRH